MSALNVKVSTEMDHSCNWRCCWGCKEDDSQPSPPTPPPTMRHSEVTRVAKRHIEQVEVVDGEVDVEFDAVHVKVKKQDVVGLGNLLRSCEIENLAALAKNQNG